MSRGHLDIYMGHPREGMFIATLRRPHAAITARPGTPGLEEALVCESCPEHIDSDWALLAARTGCGHR